MKIRIIIAAVFFAAGSKAQILYGSRWNGNVELATFLDVQAKTFSGTDTLHGITHLAQGITTFDHVNGRYFNLTDLGIEVIDAQTNSIIDTIPNIYPLQEIEYDKNANRLIGTYWNGSSEIFAQYDMSTQTYSNISVLNGVQFLVQGETAYDAANSRYYNITNLGITIINAQTGAIIDTISNSTVKMKGIEYDNISGDLIGSRWNGSNELFVTLNPSTKLFNDINVLNGIQYIVQGETSFDPFNYRYFNISNLGIAVIDVQTGTITDTISNNIHMKGIEVMYINNEYSVQPAGALSLYPNPVNNTALLEASENLVGSDLIIADLSGSKVFQKKIEDVKTVIDVSLLKPGLYFIKSDKGNTYSFIKN